MIIKGNHQEHIKSWLEISGVVNEKNIGPKITWDLTPPSKSIIEAIGAKSLRELHKENKWIDRFLLFSAWFLFIGTWYFIAKLDFGFLTLFLILLQGIILGNFFYAVRHDILMHRQFGGTRFAYIIGILMSIPMLNTYTQFLKHEDHHLHVGYDLFEEHIAELDTVWKRWVGFTGVGLLLLFIGKLKSKGSSYPNENWENPGLIKKANKIEGLLLLIWLVNIILLAFLFPYIVLMGYLIPVIIVVPALLSIKNACQHSETDVNNSMHLAQNYKGNFLIRVIYCCSVGDVHIVHHIFPKIPFWKTPKAARLMRPTFEVHNVPKRTFSEILYGYYIKGRPYRTLWEK